MLQAKLDQSFTDADVHQIISQRLQGSRPVAWEEDISRNTLDTEPFNNLAPANQLDASKIKNRPIFTAIEQLLGERTIEQAIAVDSYPIPCPQDREGYSPGHDDQYWLSGLDDYLKVMDAAGRHGVTPTTVFDFGCASGRVLRHFAAQTEIAEIWGSDINGRHIRWLYEHLPHTVKPIFNHCIPSIPIPDKSVDVISAFSVFTHIDTFETCWLAELRRILSDDGIAYLTVHNEDTWAAIRDQIDNPKNRLIQSLLKIDPEFREKIEKELPDTKTVYRFSESGPYRAQVFHSNNYLQQVWGRFFDIVEILPLHHVRQTVLVLRKS